MEERVEDTNEKTSEGEERQERSTKGGERVSVGGAFSVCWNDTVRNAGKEREFST